VLFYLENAYKKKYEIEKIFLFQVDFRFDAVFFFFEGHGFV